VADNIGLGDPRRAADKDAIVAASQRSGAHEFVERLSDGYETNLGRQFQEGTDLSIGQWQRVAIARAFFRDAPFVILDEPTAALDARAEHELFERIRELFRSRTVLLISHRFSTVRNADRIYVLDQGRIVEAGSHSDLMTLGGTYAELFTMQASAYFDPEPADAG
jgi:ATP-binding cassette, subfamily B, bacterial